MALSGADADHAKDILRYFFSSPAVPNKLTDELALIAAKCLATAVEASKAMDAVPRPPGGKPSVAWLISTVVKTAWRVAKNDRIYEAVKNTVTLKWRSAYTIAVNDASA